jgi:hypothetical protein
VSGRRYGHGGCRANRELRRSLWERDPRCHWCGRETAWTYQHGGQQPDDAATLDHFGELRALAVVLACYACNQYRARMEQELAKVRRPRLPSMAVLLAESRAWLAENPA